MKKILLTILILTVSLFSTPSFYAVNWKTASSEIRENNISVYGFIGDNALISIENITAQKLIDKNIRLNLLDQETDIKSYYLVGKKDNKASNIITTNANILLRAGNNMLIKGSRGLSDLYKQNLDVLPLWDKPIVLSSAENLVAPKLDIKNKNQTIIDMISKVSADSVLSYSKYLQNMQTRFSHAGNHRIVAEKIRQKFVELGCTTAELDSFFLPAYYLDSYNINLPDSWQYNVVATIIGSEESNNYILITGHHDNIVNPNVAGQNPYIFAPGVDDNGSSVAAVWEICRIIKKENFQPKKSIKFITFAAEESHLLGSKNYAQRASNSDMQISGVINNDMIAFNTHNQSDWSVKIMQYTGSEAFNKLTFDITNLYTSLNASLGAYNSQGSDSYSFYYYGYQASYFFESDFTPYYHSNGDTWEHIDPLYCAEVIKAGFALAIHKSEVPENITGLQVKDKGNGNELLVQWNKGNDGGFNHYKIQIGTESGNYSRSIITTDTLCTVGDLINSQIYYIGVSEVNNANYESMITECNEIPRLIPLPPVGIIAESQWHSVKVNWTANLVPDLAGYNVYRSSDSIQFDKITQLALSETLFVDNNLAINGYRYYKITSLDNDSNESELSLPSIPVRPVTLDQGIMLIDESANGSGISTSPNDTQQDQFFNSLLVNFMKVSNYDAQSNDKITLSELGPFSTVIWHNQSTELGSVFYRHQSEIKKYLDFGGNILITADKPGKLIENCNAYPTDFSENSIAEQYFGIDSVGYKAPSRFCGALPIVSGFDYLTVDSTKALESNGFHIKKIETLRNRTTAEVIYLYDSKYAANINYGYSKNQPVGLLYSNSNFKTATLAVPLYFIKQNDARKVVEYILKEKFGETLAINNDEFKISNFELLQNYPNPFNNSTVVSYHLNIESNVKLSIYNAKGEFVQSLVNGVQTAGKHSVIFNADKINSGVYFYKLESEGKSVVNKMLLVK